MAVKTEARVIPSTVDDRSHDGMVRALIGVIFVVLGVLPHGSQRGLKLRIIIDPLGAEEIFKLAHCFSTKARRSGLATTMC